MDCLCILTYLLIQRNKENAIDSSAVHQQSKESSTSRTTVLNLLECLASISMETLNRDALLIGLGQDRKADSQTMS